MRRLLPAILICAAVAAMTIGSAKAETIQVEVVIWQLDRDYPGSVASDSDLPINTVYIKTHDGTDWMATYDGHPKAVAGPDSIHELLNVYGSQGIRVAAWFVPASRDVETQLRMAEQVLDTGVGALYADLEPFAGFCDQDCDFLAENFWWRLRVERPNAKLGVIYDPRTQFWGPSATSKWLAVADSALPLCYWETYAGQQPWDDPSNCVLQAYIDLALLAPGRPLDYVPMLQGDTTPERFKAALDAAAVVGAGHVSVWRRGVVPADVWSLIGAYVPPSTRPCWVTRADGCLIKEASDPTIFLIEGGAKFPIPDIETLARMGLDANAVQAVPDRFLSTLPTTPRDGTLLSEEGLPPVNVVYGGARFAVPDPEVLAALGLEPGAVRKIPLGGLQQISLLPVDYSRLKELTSDVQYVVIRGARVALALDTLAGLLAAGRSSQLFVVSDGGLDQIPVMAAAPGDAGCDGSVDVVDALHLLRHVAGIPNLGLCTGSAGDVNCDGDIDAVDALFILRYVAALLVSLPPGCPALGRA